MSQYTEEQLRGFHKESRFHRKRLESSGVGGCFCCRGFFSTDVIKEWIDKGETAVCPLCGVDSVLPGLVIESHENLVRSMNEFWFGHGVRVTYQDGEVVKRETF